MSTDIQPTILTVTNEDQAVMKRLDLFLTKRLPDHTRSYWTQMIKHGYVTVNGGVVKPGLQLHQNDTVVILWQRMTKQDADISVVYENEDFAIINKPAGLLVHSKGDFNPEYTLADYIRDRFSLKGFDSDDDRAGIVHRLDRYTSGVMIVVKTKQAYADLQKMFQDRQVHKFYLAVTHKHIESSPLIIDASLTRDPRNPKTFTVSNTGKQAKTKVWQLNDDCLLLQPFTGRTHQLRAHLAYIHAPIVGDGQYGSTIKTKVDGRFLLHAHRIMFSFKGTSYDFSVPVPKDMSQYIHDEDCNQAFRIESEETTR